MKLTVTIARILVGTLFVFSGLIKAIDPLGLAYKMQEFFEAWMGDHSNPTSLLHWFHDHVLMFSILMITLEVALGVALLIGWQKKFITWILLLLMLFFLFLTSYVLFSGKIRACGCFGDCIPLTPMQTFTKDVILLVLIIFLLIKRKYIMPVIKSIHLVTIVLLSVILTVLLQSNALEHLPIKDCLPYKIGNNLLELRKMPADATFDKFNYSFTYKKGNEEKEFTTDNLPDSTWQFVAQNKMLIEKGNDKLPAINDFSLTSMNGNDSTEAILGQNGEYYLYFIKSFDEAAVNWQYGFMQLQAKAKQQGRNIYVVTADTEKIFDFFNKKNNFNVTVFTCDATAIKTAARCVPTIFFMKGPVVLGKWSWEDIDEAMRN